MNKSERESWERDGVDRWAGRLGGRRSVRWMVEMYGGEGKIWEVTRAGGR
jgi:hypothetical protein